MALVFFVGRLIICHCAAVEQWQQYQHSLPQGTGRISLGKIEYNLGYFNQEIELHASNASRSLMKPKLPIPYLTLLQEISPPLLSVELYLPESSI